MEKKWTSQAPNWNPCSLAKLCNQNKYVSYPDEKFRNKHGKIKTGTGGSVSVATIQSYHPYRWIIDGKKGRLLGGPWRKLNQLKYRRRLRACNRHDSRFSGVCNELSEHASGICKFREQGKNCDSDKDSFDLTSEH
jgi:hypothetical protein